MGQIANLATRRRCTHEGKDPWSTHHLVKCCSGLEKQLVNSSSGGPKHYECQCTHEGEDPWSTHHLVECCSGLEKQLVNSSSGGRKHYKCLAQCTHEGKDPWSTHHLVKCCSGLEKQLVNSSSGGRKHYECLAPLLPSPSLCNDCKTGCATAFCNPQDGSCQNQMDMPFYVMCNEPCAGEGTICGGPGRSGRTCCEPEYISCVRPTGTEEDKGDFYCGR